MRQVATADQIDSFYKNGDLDLSHYEDGIGRFRVNIHRQRGLICLNARWVKNQIMTFEQLGLPPVMREISEYPRGIIILTGTTGSGKSTTLAAMLEHVNQAMSKHIITVEDPIEYEFQDNQSFFEQREVGIDTISFASALKHALRQDPDIIMVGEMRDLETADIGLKSAMTGHLVLSTLHTNDAASAVNRLINMGVPPYLVASAQVTVLAQRLMRKICAGCKTQTIPEPETLTLLGLGDDQPVGDAKVGSITRRLNEVFQERSRCCAADSTSPS